jgi:hypothetical protein
MRAMSLADNNSEGEQNEMRLLQQQLSATNQLVSTLSMQLNELKQQVRSKRIEPLYLLRRVFLFCASHDQVIV